MHASTLSIKLIVMFVVCCPLTDATLLAPDGPIGQARVAAAMGGDEVAPCVGAMGIEPGLDSPPAPEPIAGALGTLQLAAPPVSQPAAPPAASTTPLTGQRLANVMAFARLLGYVRHFHPSDEAAAADWNTFAVEGIRTIESAEDAEELASTLQDIFEPVAPTVRVFPSGRRPETPAALLTPPVDTPAFVVNWMHRGYSGGGFLEKNGYSSKRIRVPLGKMQSSPFGESAAHPTAITGSILNPANTFVADLGCGVSCSVPLALYADRTRTLPAVPDAKDDNSSPSRIYDVSDRAVRIASVALAWNVLRYFYPYFDVTDVDWEAELPKTLQAAAIAEDDLKFKAALQRMVAKLKDGHSFVFVPPGSSPSDRWLPFLWEWVEDQLVITRTLSADDGDAKAAIKRGDVVTAVNGRPVKQALAEIEELMPGSTPQFRRYFAMRRLRKGSDRDVASIRINRPAENIRGRDIYLKYTLHAPSPNAESELEKISESRPGIYYIDITRINDNDFAEALPELERAKAIIFDWRGYPRHIEDPEILFGHLVDHKCTSPQWLIPEIERPDETPMHFSRNSGWDIKPLQPHLDAHKVFIINVQAISCAESCLGIVEAYKLGDLVGEPTAGTNGNVTNIILPARCRISFTGMKVLKHDGSRHHGVGILPTIPCSRTVEGIIAGKDELLEKAIEVADSR